jgi:hypothetical protein
MNTPESLIPALRQYRHNHSDDGFVAGFDYELTKQAFSELELKNKELVILAKEMAENYLTYNGDREMVCAFCGADYIDSYHGGHTKHDQKCPILRLDKLVIDK